MEVRRACTAGLTGATRVIRTATLVTLLLSGGRGVAMAGSINGFLEWNYSSLDSTSRQSGLASTSTQVDSLTQRYNLSLLTNPLPALRLAAGGLFEQQSTRSDVTGPGRETTLTTWQPSVELSLLNPIYNGGIGYTRREETEKASGTPSAKQINDDYHLTLGWRPLGLPTVDLQLSRVDRYDPLRIQEDTRTDRAVLALRALPVKDLDLRYQFTYNDATDNLQQLETRETANTGRASYAGQFFDKRVSLFTNYNVSTQTIQTSTSGTGFVDFQLFPAFGLSSLSDVPQTGALTQNSQLIAGNTGVSSGINIGVTAPDETWRNLGVDFFAPTEINHILVWTDRQLPPAIAATYSWEIYISSDNVTWTLWRTLASAPYGPFDNRFDLQFDTVKTRYIKVVTHPLSKVAATLVPTFENPDRIFITTLQTFLRRPAADARGKTSTVSQLYSLDVKAKLLDTPSLYYNGSLFLSSGGVPATLRYTLSNGLSLTHPLTDKLTVTGRVAREDTDEAAGHTAGYAYDASLRATPLKTISDTLLYSGRVDFRPAGRASSNSLYTFNSAELYRGVNLNLGGGITSATNERGVSTDGSSFLFGMGIVPFSTLTTNLTHTMNRSTQSGGGEPRRTLSMQRSEASVAWRPFTTLYLYTALGFLDQTDRKPDLTQNYGVNWSPFPDGTLQCNFVFSENLQTLDSARTRLITPSLTWQITNRIVLDGSFSLIDTDSNSGTTRVRVLSSNLRINF